MTEERLYLYQNNEILPSPTLYKCLSFEFITFEVILNIKKN